MCMCVCVYHYFIDQRSAILHQKKCRVRSVSSVWLNNATVSWNLSRIYNCVCVCAWDREKIQSTCIIICPVKQVYYLSIICTSTHSETYAKISDSSKPARSDVLFDSKRVSDVGKTRLLINNRLGSEVFIRERFQINRNRNRGKDNGVKMLGPIIMRQWILALTFSWINANRK